MKKALIASAACLACTGAFAQVNLYGIVDVGVTRVTGLAGGSKTQLNSGIMEGSRFGFRLEEDMGGGFKTLAMLENRFYADTGSMSDRPPSGNQLPDRLTAGLPTTVANALTNVAIGPTLGVNHVNTRFFDRQSWVGLVTPVGGFLMGRQYTPAFETLVALDMMNTESALSAAQLVTIPAGLDIRYDDSLQYRIVKGPWNAALTTSLVGGSNSSANRLLGFNTLYKGGDFQAGIGYNTKNNSAGEKALSTTIAGATATVGDFKLSGMWVGIKEANPSSGPELAAGLTAQGVPTSLVNNILERLKQEANLIHAGVRYNMGAAGHVTFAVNKLNDKRASNADVTTYGVAYTYPMSKRTDLNLAVVRFDNSANAQAAPGGNAYLGGVTAKAGQDSNSVAFAIRHRF